jgi:hypothetical protein
MTTQPSVKIPDRSGSIHSGRSIVDLAGEASDRAGEKQEIATCLAEMARRVEDLNADTADLATIAHACATLMLAVNAAQRQALPPRNSGPVDAAEALLNEFCRIYPRVQRATARTSAEFREFARIRQASPTMPDLKETPKIRHGMAAMQALGVDVVSASRIADQLGDATCASIAGWVRAQNARSPSGLALSVARKRGYDG